MQIFQLIQGLKF